LLDLTFRAQTIGITDKEAAMHHRIIHLLNATETDESSDSQTQVKIGETVTVKGWVRSRRDSKAGFSFIELNDGSCMRSIQVIADQALANYESGILKLGSGCSISAQGRLVASQGKGQAVEIQAESVEILGFVDNPETYPIAKKRHSFEFLREQAHLRTRTNTFGAMTRIRHRVCQLIHQFFDQKEYFWVNTPVISTSDCEGAGELLRVSHFDMLNVPTNDKGEVDWQQDFFGQASYLTVSGQLHGEALACGLGQIYTFGPTFRAEDSHTSRHLAEFWMLEPELAFGNFADLQQLSEDMLQFIAQGVLEHCQEDMAFFNKQIEPQAISRLQQIVDNKFQRMTYTQAVEILEHSGQKFEFPVSWGVDLASEHERFITETYLKKPVILIDYPKEIKAFYMRENDDNTTVAAMDVLVPGLGEIIGGSQREERLDRLDIKMEAMGVKDELWWYRDLRRFGTVPHGGFGLGFERLLSYITGMDNVRDTIPFPRVPGTAKF